MEAVPAGEVCAALMRPEDRFALLYDAHYDEIHAYCSRRVHSDAVADAVSEVFTVVWRRLDDVPGAAARAWIFGVARGVIRNHWRSRDRSGRLASRVRIQRQPLSSETDASVVRSDDAERVRAALATLRVADQEILRLAAWEDLSGPEIAQALGISLTAAQQRLHRAKRRLSRALSRHGGPEPEGDELP